MGKSVSVMESECWGKERLNQIWDLWQAVAGSRAFICFFSCCCFLVKDVESTNSHIVPLPSRTFSKDSASSRLSGERVVMLQSFDAQLIGSCNSWKI